MQCRLRSAPKAGRRLHDRIGRANGARTDARHDLQYSHPMPTLTFLGAAGTVTGSKHLLDLDGRLVLVDCGLFQGLKELRERNWAALPVDPRRIDAVVLTHAHLDHCGYLPRLVGGGFRGRIFCTPGTKDLCTLILPDSAHIQEEDARQANRRGYSKHQPALPLYTELDAARTLTQLQPVGYDRPVPVVPGVEVEFINAGHLLGSAYARFRIGDKTLLFGGDLGRYGRPVLPDPMPVEAADVLLLESTYGDRLHLPDDGGARLAEIINETVKRGGKIIIPSFAVGRVEEVLYWLRAARADQPDPGAAGLRRQPDGGRRAAVLRRARERARSRHGTDRAGRRRVRHLPDDRSSRPRRSRSALVASTTPAIVIAASGMATGGRVLHHLAGRAAEPEQHGAVRRLSGGRHARPPAGGRRQARQDSGSAGAGRRAHRAARLDVGARRRRRDHAVAVRVRRVRRR